MDQDTIERNRMMAKLHLMEYDETLKHRVKNDLESEEFPEDFMVDVPDKLPKQSVTKKLSQAEARLKRFKNANAKRGNNVTKSQTIALKKRTDPIFPAKFSPRYVEIKDKREDCETFCENDTCVWTIYKSFPFHVLRSNESGILYYLNNQR